MDNLIYELSRFFYGLFIVFGGISFFVFFIYFMGFGSEPGGSRARKIFEKYDPKNINHNNRQILFGNKVISPDIDEDVEDYKSHRVILGGFVGLLRILVICALACAVLSVIFHITDRVF